MNEANTAPTADTLPTTRRPPGSAAVPQLRLVFGPDVAAGTLKAAERSRGLKKPTSVGRSSKRDWTLTDPHLSSAHAKIDKGRLEDLGSKHGTFVNGVKLEAGTPRKLSPGDVVRMGQSLFVVTPDAAREDAVYMDKAVGTSPSLDRIERQIAQIASHTARVLVIGAPGVGKELVAEAFHQRVAALRGRPARNVPYEAVNVAATPKDVQLSVLFGAVRGAFTGATGHLGLFAKAKHGVLFLDEIGEASSQLQAALLRALQKGGTFQKVGGTTTEAVDLAVVCATNRDLPAEVAAGRFRADLLSRMRGVEIAVPPISERREDILPLLGAFLHDGPSAARSKPLPLDVYGAERVLRHDYPGNVRDLDLLAGRIRGASQDLRRPLRDDEVQDLLMAPAPGPTSAPSSKPLSHTNKADFITALERHGPNYPRLAQALGCDPKTARKWHKKHGLDR